MKMKTIFGLLFVSLVVLGINHFVISNKAEFNPHENEQEDKPG